MTDKSEAYKIVVQSYFKKYDKGALVTHITQLIALC